MNLEDSTELLSLIDTLDLRDVTSDSMNFTISMNGTTTVDCSFGSKICHLDSGDFDHFMYHLFYQTVVDEDYGFETYIPYLEYIDLESNNYLTAELFDVINLLYPYLAELEGITIEE